MLDQKVVAQPKVRWPLFTSGDHVLVAVSGGPDSLSLLHVLWAEREGREMDGVEAAHLDHGLRGDEAAAEAKWVAEWCAERGIPCHVGRVDVAALALAHKQGKQEAARAARYQFLEEIAAQIGATKIATGHTRDDQAETVLHHVLRGTGLDGLRGILERRGLFVRPLLDVSRVEIEAYCTANGLEPRRDPSNLSPTHYTRNRIRLELLPLLARDYNPAVGDALVRLSAIADAEVDYLQARAEEALATITREETAAHLVLDRAVLAELHPALLRRVLRTAIARQRGTGEGVTFAHIEQLFDAVTDPERRSFALTLPHSLCLVRLERDILILTSANALVAVLDAAMPLLVPGSATLPEIGWKVSTSFEEMPGGAALDADAVQTETLVLRCWRPGDRVDPLGMGGRHKKVGDIFTDSKTPRTERHSVPIVADAAGILWVVGYCISERAKTTPQTRRRLYLRAEVPTTHPAISSRRNP